MWALDHAEWPAFYENWKQEQAEAFERLELKQQQEMIKLQQEREAEVKRIKAEMKARQEAVEKRAREVREWWNSQNHGKNIAVMCCSLVVFSIGSLACLSLVGGLTTNSDREDKSMGSSTSRYQQSYEQPQYKF